MVAVYLSPALNAQVLLLPNGAVNQLGYVYCFYGQTTTPANTYTSNTGTGLNSNPIQIGLNGRLPYQLWIPQGQATKFEVQDVNGVALQTIEDVLGVNDPSLPLAQANGAYNTANLAYVQANTGNVYAQTSLTNSNTAKTSGNASANLMAVFANGTVVLAAGNINFNNTSTVNVNVTANISTFHANVQLNVNTGSLVLSTGQAAQNGYCRIASNCIIQWGSFPQSTTMVPGYGGSAVTVTFPLAFPNACWSVVSNLSSSGRSGSGVAGGPVQTYMRVVPGSMNKTTFQLVMDASGPNYSLTPTVYWFATGY